MVAKSDIDGSEFNLFPHLVLTKAMCALDLVFAEWHTHHFDPAISREREKLLRNLEPNRRGTIEAYDLVTQLKVQLDDMFAPGSNKTEKCSTEFSEIDDESYRLDGLPWAKRAFCNI